MREPHRTRLLRTLGLFGLLLVAVAASAQGQYTQDRRNAIRVNIATFPSGIRKGYRLFYVKCNECHGLDRSLKLRMSAGQWTAIVKQMQAMPSSKFSDPQGKAIIDFLSYYAGHQMALKQAAGPASPSKAVAAGERFYESHGCDACHAIGGKGGTVGPALSDVGKRLTSGEIRQILLTLRAGKSAVMPPLPPKTTDQQINDLVAFLLSLKGSSK